ncbi:hypothetical protein D3C73_836210 [compost metagenome]
MEGAAGLRLLLCGGDLQRRQERIAKPHVHQIRLIQLHHQRHMVEGRAEAAVARADFAGNKLHVKADVLQQRGKQPVQLIAKAAAVAFDNFIEQRRFLQMNPLAINNAQVLKGYAQHMAAV